MTNSSDTENTDTPITEETTSVADTNETDDPEYITDITNIKRECLHD